MTSPAPALAAVIAAAALSLAPAALAHPTGAHKAAETAALSGPAAQAGLVVDAFHTALKAGDTVKAANLVADDALIFEAGFAERSKAEYAAEHLAADAKFEKAATETVLRRIGEASGDLAWIATEGRVQARSGEKVTDRLTTESMVLRRTAAGWRIVHVHWSSRAAPTAAVKP